jgi:hypothetical protein
VRGGEPVGDRADDGIGARGHVGGDQHLLAERLGPLEPRGGGRRSEAGDPCGRQGVGDPGRQRDLGADHHQVDGEPARQRGDPRDVVGGDGVELGLRGDARVARRGEQLRRTG